MLILFNLSIVLFIMIYADAFLDLLTEIFIYA